MSGKIEEEELAGGGLRGGPSAASPGDEQDKFRIFENWLLTNGTKFEKLELRDYGNEVRGCHATREILDDEIIIQVPLKCLITVEMGKETSVGKAILNSGIELDAPKHIFLMIFMLVDRQNHASFFKPYYDILPKTLNNMPIFWTPDELRYLEGSYLLTQIEERNIAIESDYHSICSLVPSFSRVATLEEFKWARMCVCSRNFGIVANGLRTAALVPYADMLNHFRPRETKWQYDDYLQGFTVTSIQGIATSAQVYDSYGQKCNHRFLLNYGFSVENNAEPDGFNPNEVPIVAALNPTDPFSDIKCAIWRKDSSFPSKMIRVCISDNENTRILFSMLRLIEAGREDLDQLLTTLTGSPASSIIDFDNPHAKANTAASFGYRFIRDAQNGINLRNEMRAMRHLLDLCNDLLAKYPTSFTDDVVRLGLPEDDPRTLAQYSNERHAVIQVKGEKEVLLFYRDYAAKAIALLKLSHAREFEEALGVVRETMHPMAYQLLRINIVKLKIEDQRNAESKSVFLDYAKPMVV